MAQTLQEFTLNLLNNEQARSLFAADPTGALQSAGLGGITAGDVHEILPLVLDMAPTHVVEAFEQTLAGGALPGLPGLPGADDAISTLQHLTAAVPALPVDGLARELPVDGLAGGLPSIPSLPGLEGGLPSVPGLDGLTGALPSVPGLDSLSGLEGGLPNLPLDGVARELPVDGLAGGLPSVPGLESLPGLDSLPLPVEGLPAVPSLPNLPLDGLTAAVPAVPGLPGLPNLSDPTALVDEVRGAVANPARSLDQVQQLASQVPVVATNGIPAVPAVENLVGNVTNVASSVDVTKTLDSTTHTVAGAAGNVPVAGKVVADTTSHVTGAVHGVDVDGVTNNATNTVTHITDITKVATGDPIHVVTSIAHDPITAATNIANVSHTLDTVNTVANSVHGDQVLQHVNIAVDADVKDLNIGDGNHIGIGNVDLGGVHVDDVTHNLDAGHLPGF